MRSFLAKEALVLPSWLILKMKLRQPDSRKLGFLL